jgi:hypothetical protein
MLVMAEAAFVCFPDDQEQRKREERRPDDAFHPGHSMAVGEASVFRDICK